MEVRNGAKRQKTVTVAENYREYEVVKGIQFGFIELSKFRAKKPDLDNKLNQWLTFIDNNDKELVKNGNREKSNNREGRAEKKVFNRESGRREDTGT